MRPRAASEQTPSVSYLLIRLVLCFPEEANVLDESGLDVFVVHELTEDVELLAQELVGEIHLIERRVQLCNMLRETLCAHIRKKRPQTDT